MGTRHEDAPYLGLLIPDVRIKTGNLRTNDGAAGNSDYSQASPRPGVPAFAPADVATTSTTAGDYSPSLSLEALGEQDPATSYTIQTLKGGLPGIDGATVARRDALSGGVWYGWNSHNVPGVFPRTPLLDRDGSAGVNYTAVTTADNQALFLVWDNLTIKSQKYNAETHTAGPLITAVDTLAATTADISAFASAGPGKDLVDAIVLPSGRVVAYYLTTELDGLTTAAQLWASYSDDHGASWRSGQYLGLDAVLDLTGGRALFKLRAAYSDGNVLLLIEKTWGDPLRRGLIQYASDDTGLNFVRVRDDEIEGATTDNSHPDILVDDATGAFVIFFEGDAANRIYAARIASPFIPYTEGSTVEIHPGNAATDHIAAYADTDGALYLTTESNAAIGVELYKSLDGGSAWAAVEEPFGWVSNQNVFRWDVTIAAGRAIWLWGQTASAGTLPLTDHKFTVIECGGWEGLSQPRILGKDPTTNRGFGNPTGPEALTWYPTEKPDLLGWTLTGSAVAVSGTAPLGLPITTSSHYSRAPAGASTDGVIVYFGLTVNSGGSGAALQTGIDVVLDAFHVEARFSSTGVTLHDVNAGAAVGAVTLGMTTERVFKLALRKSAGTANGCSITLYRRAANDVKWFALITATTLTAGASSANLIDWGTFAASQDCEWSFVHYVMDSGNGDQTRYTDDLSQSLLNSDPFALYGAPLPVPPFRRYVSKDLFIRGTSGPATRADVWSIAPRFDHPVSALDPANSATPASGWRSTDTTEQTIAWDMTLDTTLGSSSIGVYLGGINFIDATLLGWNGAAWVTLATLAADEGSAGLACTVVGDTVRVDTGVSVDGRYVQRGEFVGGFVRFNGGDRRRIVWNSEGSYTDRTTKRPEFRFEGTAPGGSTTSCDLVRPDALAILHENLTLYDRYALRIPAQNNVDGYFEIGVAIVGAMALFGRKYARGRVIETAPNTSIRQDAAGRRVARSNGPSRRAASVVWQAVDLQQISTATPDPDYISMRSDAAAPPIADRYGAPLLVEGLLAELGGAERPVVYVPNIPATTGGSQETRLAGRERYIYGRIVGSVTRTAQLGTEAQDEVVGMTGLRIEEEL